MKSVVKFLFFILYTTCIFFLTNKMVLIAIILNLLMLWLSKIKLKKVIYKTLKILPFILFTFIINIILDSFENAIWIAIKLLVVCNITMIYSETTTIFEVAETIQNLCMPLKIFKIDTQEIKIMVCISLAMIPLLIKEISEVKDSCRARNINFNVKNTKIILSKYFISILRKVNDLEETLIAKGYENGSS